MTEDLYGTLDTICQDGYQSTLEPACRVLTGMAGTGKTTLIKRRVEENPDALLLTATTGISAVNLNCTTINSILGYFDEDSLRDCWLRGQLNSRLRDLVRLGTHNLLIEEMSMLTGTALDIIYRAACETGSASKTGTPLGLVLVGDFCQLPPVHGSWAFEADCWPKFAANVERLSRVWRQDQPGFLEALTYARNGRGDDCARVLTECGAKYHTSLSTEFNGTTIVPKNDMVDRYNAEALMRIRSPLFTVASARWGKQRGEWKNIPDRMDLKLGAYVMILANAPDFSYVNGDCGYVQQYADGGLVIELVRTRKCVEISRIVRNVEYHDRPDGFEDCGSYDATEYHPIPSGMWKGVYYSRSGKVSRRRWVTGQVYYFPVRLAYATTVHKSQGLSLDRIQIDYRHQFFKSPAMLYVALSRCRTVEGLRLVGMRELLAKHCTVDEKVKAWL